jgi:hypothetical protein
MFVTSGDDPGTESNPSYIPKGYFYYSKSEGRIPLPILGLIPLSNAGVDYVVHTEALPKVRGMGANALINASIDYNECHWVLGLLFGCMGFGDSTTVRGTAVRRPGPVVNIVPTYVTSSQPSSRRPEKVTPPPATLVSGQGTVRKAAAIVPLDTGCEVDIDCSPGSRCSSGKCQCTFDKSDSCSNLTRIRATCLAGTKPQMKTVASIELLKCVTPDGRRHGPAIARYKDNNYKALGAFFDGKRNGPWVFWNTDGNIEAACRYKRGHIEEKHGRWERNCK